MQACRDAAVGELTQALHGHGIVACPVTRFWQAAVDIRCQMKVPTLWGWASRSGLI